MKAELDERLRQFIDGELDEAEARMVLHAVADDATARDLLRFEYRLQRHFQSVAEERAVPDGFSDRVMQAVEAEEVSRHAVKAAWVGSIQTKLDALWDAFLTPRPLIWRPAYATALVLLLVGAGFFGGRLTTNSLPDAASAAPTVKVQPASTEADETLMRFLYVDSGASSVAVAGDFTNWEPLTLEAQEVNGKTIWSGMIPVPDGEHRYMFVINGQKWVTDPLAPVQRDDGFGNKNAILVL